ncbi:MULTISPECIES: 4-phosphoerythronate dehydrogenase [Legionella]|uniref:Erythronate-4-phosphate dehydrogenase n=1 Tax=Legionella maceachernii TaxID=466 RepID=A0A0W0W101_9GAMM|nr:4-phosphoerythronate dehydrogenase [Legionella maceachernii]KTD25983.1 erythronate-4-phosphate dehydrogenase [Legionella maceachernii]SJZ49936.1 erythronate-4-phosphate dehydrogenase [Legionella maceachernii]SUP03771.1 Erythronate-4-phosphate dehydrogenase [Legionella maceachernii]
MKILADASLPGLIEAFPKPFELSVYRHADEIPHLLNDQHILLCRSTLKVNEQLLKGQSLRYVATASSGTDHIDYLYLQNNGIELIDAKGSNAVAVADYVIATLAFLQKYKGFSEVQAGVIGVGEVGAKVVKRLMAAGMEVHCYDPLKSEKDPLFSSCTLETILQCDLIAIHANLHDNLPHPSRNLFSETLLNQLKPTAVIINASRGGIMDEEALLQLKKPIIYCTDVYTNEPHINPEIIKSATLCTPHIAGHSIEAKYNAIHMVSKKLHACFNLAPPSISEPAVTGSISFNEVESWQELALHLYNPLEETTLLKSSHHLQQSFLSLRKAHQKRHDFCKYLLPVSDAQTKEILGI